MKKVLITGAGSYIGTSFIKWVKENHPGEFETEELDMIEGTWKEKDFSGYDAVFHVAGIAHQKETRENAHLYYEVNRDLAIATAKKAKEDGVKQFVLLSSMSVYGKNTGRIYMGDKAIPSTHYGKSKLQAERVIQKMSNETFRVAIIRPPMVYGWGCKGNYQRLAKLAKIVPFFPEINNERSMLYIDNLTEFLSLLLRSDEEGIFFPQNKEYVQTSRMVQLIGKAHGHKVVLLKGLEPIVKLFVKYSRRSASLLNKVFGSLVYDESMSMDFSGEYRVVGFERSIEDAEKEQYANMNEIKSKTDPLVSLITVSYNSEKTIGRTIESVLRQSYNKIEYLIIDGKSSDKTVEIAHSYEKVFEEKNIIYRVISEEDNGIYDAMNKGIKLATGELIGIINSDDWYERNAIQTVINNYKKTNFDFYYANINLVKKDGSKIIKKSRKDKIATSRHWNHPSTFVKKSLYEQLGCYKNRGLYDDFEFYLRVRRSGAKMEVGNSIIANFSTGGVSNDGDIAKCIDRMKERYLCYKDNHYSKLYILESFFTEFAKFIFKK